MGKDITEQQKRILDALSGFVKIEGYSPSYRELAEKLGIKSLNTIHFHLKKLEEKGLIKRTKSRYRGVGLAQPSTLRIPVFGTVPAGPPNLAAEQYDEFIDVDSFIGKGTIFGLRIKGDSMKDAGILEGDIVIVRWQPTAENGDIIVARFEDETTVKYFKHQQDGIYLVPANDQYPSIPLQNAQIVGKVTGVLRRYENL